MSAELSLLIVDDDERYRTRLQKAFEKRGFRCNSAADVDEAVVVAQNKSFAFAVVDLRMPNGSGLDLVARLRALSSSMKIVVLTGYGSIATAVEAIKRGAFHYMTKPADADDLLVAFAKGSEPLDEAAAQNVPSLARAEWEHINRVLDDCGGNISQAARVLKIQRRSLQRKLQKFPVSQ